jgi:hypothetical protein
MPPVAAGPIVLGQMPLGPRIAHDGLFAGLLEPVVSVLGASDGVLSAYQREIVTNTDAGLDARFESTIGHAADLAAAQPGAFADQTAARLVDAGGGTSTYHDGVQQYLPQPSAPIGQGFREFPTPDFGNPGNNGVDPGDPGAGGEA